MEILLDLQYFDIFKELKEIKIRLEENSFAIKKEIYPIIEKNYRYEILGGWLFVN